MSPLGMGQKGFIAFKREVTYGTAVAPAAGQYNRYKRCTVKNRPISRAKHCILSVRTSGRLLVCSCFPTARTKGSVPA